MAPAYAETISYKIFLLFFHCLLDRVRFIRVRVLLLAFANAILQCFEIIALPGCGIVSEVLFLCHFSVHLPD